MLGSTQRSYAVEPIVCCMNSCTIEVHFVRSEVQTSFKWSVQEPFSLTPSSGTLAPKTSCVIKATFSPKVCVTDVS